MWKDNWNQVSSMQMTIINSEFLKVIYVVNI